MPTGGAVPTGDAGCRTGGAGIDILDLLLRDGSMAMSLEEPGDRGRVAVQKAGDFCECCDAQLDRVNRKFDADRREATQS